MPPRRPPHLSLSLYACAQPVFRTMCTEDRHKCFSDLEVGRRACTQLLQTAAGWWVEVIAYCFMPDHLHVLVEGKSEDANSRKRADIFRQVSGFHFRRERGHRL